MRTSAVIPARMGSSRYPGKPLCDIHGLPMVEHVYRRTTRANLVDETYVATPDEEIRAAVESFGGDAIMTGSHERCTTRVAEAAEDLDTDVVVVMHGDEPLIHPEMIDAAIEPMLEDDSIDCVNLVREYQSESAFRDPNNLKMVMDQQNKALYISREPIPSLYDVEFGEQPVYQQVCAMPFRRDVLSDYADLPETPLERAESIDNNRLLEHGYDIHLVEIEQGYITRSVDTPEDHEIVNDLMADDDLFAEYAHLADEAEDEGQTSRVK